MKTLKKILLVLGILIILVLVVGIFLPSKAHVERSIVIKAPVGNAFAQVNTLKNWVNWSPWHKMDPDMAITYFGPESGKDAKYSWTSDKKMVGNGKLVIAESEPDSLVTTVMIFDRGKGTASFWFSKTPEGTKVTWEMESDLG